MKIIKFFILIFTIISSCAYSQDYIATKQTSTQHVQMIYRLAMQLFENKQWHKAIEKFSVLIENYSDNFLVKEATFYTAVSYFNIKDYWTANNYFSDYLKNDFNPKFFEETMHYKFLIAKIFLMGEKKKMGGSFGPRILSGYEDANVIFEEIISSMPNDELAIQSMFCRGQVLAKLLEYKESISVFEQLIERFENHVLAKDSFVEITKVYLQQVDFKKQEQDILELAELNYTRFLDMFPEETEKATLIEDLILSMKEVYAQGFLEIAAFYEKTNKKQAAIIYYNKIIKSYPKTKASKKAIERLKKIK